LRISSFSLEKAVYNKAGSMSLEEEKLLPRPLRDKQFKSTGNIRGWRYEDIPLLVKTCQELGLAIYGGHAVFFLSDAVSELYWKKANPKLKTLDENWPQYVDRSCFEFLQMVEELYILTDFEQEATHSFDRLREKKKSGLNILDYLYFKIDIVSETRYAIYFKPDPYT
jgi:hypothetical protein